MSNPSVEDTPFTDALIEKIADTIDVTDDKNKRWLAHHLRELPEDAKSYRTYRVIRKPAQIKREAEQIENACIRLLKCLEADHRDGSLDLAPESINLINGLLLWHVGHSIDPENTSQVVERGPARQKFREYASAIVSLRNAARAVQADVARNIKPGQGGRRHESDWALEEVLRQLIQLYQEVTGRKPGTSVDWRTGDVGGPLVRFLELCLPHCGWALTRKAIRSRVRRLPPANP